jgi:hypothetical protein
MLNLQTLAGILRDEELRQKLTRVTSAKIKADIKALQANAELSRHLVEGAVRSRPQGGPADGEKVFKSLINEHLDYYSTLIELSAAFNDRLLARLAAMKKDAAAAGSAASALTMNLRGAVGTTLRAPFEIENNRPDPVTALFRLTPYVNEDGSQLVAANHAFDPPQAVVPPGSKLRVTFVQPVTEGFTAGREYLATISVDGLDAMQIVVRLHVDAAAAASHGEATGEAAATGSPAAQEPSPEQTKPDTRRRRSQGTGAAKKAPRKRPARRKKP